MSFLSSLFLWGLPLASVPVIVHLLNRRRRHVLQWGAMQFLLEAVPRRRRIWRLDDLLLMLLRTAAVAAFVLALARPLLRSSWFGGGPRDVILVLDTSLSTSQTVGEVSLFDKQSERADELIDRLAEGDVVRVLLASTTPEWLAPVGIPISAESKRELRSRLAKLKPTLASADMMRCVQEAADADAADEKATRVITVLTDGKSYGWRAQAGHAWRGLAQKLHAMPTRAVVNVVSVQDPDSAAANLSLQSVVASRAIAGAGETVALTAAVKNTGHVATDPTLAAWAVADSSIGVTSLPGLAPGEQTTASIEHSFDSPGVYEVTCRVRAPDDLAMDDVGRFVVQVVDAVPVLVVDAAPQADPLHTETGYLLAALGHDSHGPNRDLEPVFRPTVVDASGLRSVQLSDFRCVVLANVPRLPLDALAKLTSYVRRGGGLWIALGDRTDLSFFNEALFGQAKGLSPLPLSDPTGDASDHERFVVIHPPTTHHPATKLLADTQRLDIDRVRVYRRHRFVRTEKDKEASVLLTTAEGSPLAVQKVFGRGRVIVQTVPLGVSWSNLPLCRAYVVIAHEWLWYLGEPTTTRWNLNVGEALNASFPSGAFGQTGQVATPLGRSINVESEVQERRRVFHYSKTFWPGRYELIVKDGDEARRAFPFYVQRDAGESDLSALSQAESEALASAGGMRFVTDPLADALDGRGAGRAQPLWTVLLVSLLVLMLIELVLAGALGKRRSVQSPAVIMNADPA